MVRRATLMLVALGCGTPAFEDAGAPPEPAAQRATAFGVIDFGDAPEGLDGDGVLACAACHPRHADEWRSSAHAAAFTDPLFVEEHSGDPFCTDCHAPRARDVEREPELARVGVDCASCHLREGVIHAARVSGRAPHPSVADRDREGAGLCRTCHQFDFPRNRSVPMQDTVREWEASGLEETCVDCHAPNREGHTTHRFAGHRDEALLSRALLVDATARRDGWSTHVVLRLRAHEVGHAVPTGDVFRRLEVRAWVEGRPDNAASELLWRRFDVERGVWTPTEDQRVPPPGGGERVVELRVPDSGDRIVWAVDLWSLDPRLAPRFDADVTLHTRMATGTLEVP